MLLQLLFLILVVCLCYFCKCCVVLVVIFRVHIAVLYSRFHAGDIFCYLFIMYHSYRFIFTDVVFVMVIVV